GSKENPADDYSRPLSVEEFLEKRSFECQLNLLELANVAEAYEVPKYDVIAAINAPPPGSTSEAVEKGKSEPEVVELPGFEHCQDWDTLVREVKPHLTSMVDSKRR